ncbi:hypothetical protein EsVE80_02370 [Enterococcus saigonensis]|uniref:Mga helix-turn-helix domain-containing protein n=1 Tax=Enterococcus saigonensis TaxID=1805431 RepID=A0A679ILN7_9ENTE|nr:helix-turn-helix domain-containing protein [Enterococcus saigonensis]BCA84714.1 hypothetical protein EsVE80_02370 [Enterococcus saigonensis]
MLLSPLILEDAARQKISVMEFFSDKEAGTYSINYLCSELNLSYTTLSTLTQEIHENLLNLVAEPFLITNGKILWQPANYQHNEYIQYLVRTSIPYNFILYSLTKPEVTFEKFCEDFYLSQSTILRKLRPLKKYLNSFGIRLLASKMKIAGNEAMLRMFYTTYLWAGNLGKDIHLSQFDFSDERAIMRKLQFDKACFMHPREIFLRLAVNRLRAQQGHKLELPKFKTLPFSKFLPELTSYCQKFITDPQQAYIQGRFISYMLYFTPFYINIYDFRIKELNDYYEALKKNKNSLINLIEEYEQYFFTELIPKTTPSYEETFLLRINLFVTFMNYITYQGDVPLIMDITRQKQTHEHDAYLELLKRNGEFFRRICRRKDFAWLTNCYDDLIEDITYVILPTFKKCCDDQILNVGILTIPDYFIMQTIKEVLEQFGFVKVYFTNFDDPNIDFFISTFDTLLPDNLTKPNFIIDLIADNNYEKELFAQLWNTYRKKVLQRSRLQKKSCQQFSYPLNDSSNPSISTDFDAAK